MIMKVNQLTSCVQRGNVTSSSVDRTLTAEPQRCAVREQVKAAAAAALKHSQLLAALSCCVCECQLSCWQAQQALRLRTLPHWQLLQQVW